MQQRVQGVFEVLEEGRGSGGRVEEIAGSPLHGESAGVDQRHGLQTGQFPPFVPLAEQQVLLRVRFAHVGSGIGGGPDERLRDGLDLQ